MRRRTKKLAALTVAAAGVAVFVGGSAAGLEAGAVELGDPVSYEVGDTLVFASRHRNESCSVTRNVVNDGPVALKVVGTVQWDGHLTPLWPNQGSAAGDQGIVLDPGERATFVWTNTDYLPHVATGLTVRWSVMVADGVAQIGANESELISPCRVVVEPPVGPSVPTVDTTVPTTTPPPSSSSTTSPSSSTVPAPDTTSPPTVVSGPAPPPLVETQVLTSSVGPVVEPPRAKLPTTGTSLWQLAALGVGLVATGASIVARPGRKLTEVEV